MEENNQQQNIPLLCRKKCGFFGSPNFDGLCSKCHRSAQLAAQQTGSISSLDSKLPVSDIRRSSESPIETILKRDSPTLPSEHKQAVVPVDSSLSEADNTNSPASGPNTTSSQAELQADSETAGLSDILDKVKDDSKPSSPASAKSPRCDICRKRVGPAGGYSCRCEGVFCSLHRYSDAHNCSYDYRRAGQEDIRRSNPQVVCSKLPKI
ncbi:hypothetical protein AHF37_05164 [Paragonimus kellicotti]|nr:hypothetical protein AHF37_05164 [Paragonimus kellicotti]